MRDPHVKTLVYKLRHTEDVDYERAGPVQHDIGVCVLRLESEELRCVMKTHFADEASARQAVEPYLEVWKTSAGLELGPNEFDFQYADAEIIDRDPQAGEFQARVRIRATAGATLTLHHSRSQYPDPPSRFAVDQLVSDMYYFYRRYREGRERPGVMGYMVLQSLCYDSGGIREAAERYAVSEAVLRKLSDLTSNKGGRVDGRKGPYSVPYTVAERQWIEHATKVLIRRAAEYAADPGAQFEQLTMGHLPSLT